MQTVQSDNHTTLRVSKLFRFVCFFRVFHHVSVHAALSLSFSEYEWLQTRSVSRDMEATITRPETLHIR